MRLLKGLKGFTKVGRLFVPELVPAGARGDIVIRGDWVVEQVRGGEVIDDRRFKNLVTTQGLNYFLDAGLDGDTTVTTWYAVAYDDSTSYTPAAGSTYASPGSGTELTTGVDEATRQAWVSPGASAGVITNSAAPAEYTANTAINVEGGSMVGADGTSGTPSTKGDAAATNGYMVCGATFTTVVLASSDVLKITISLTLADT